MNAQQAWNVVKEKDSKVLPETCYELDTAFVFSTRPSGTKPGNSTSSLAVLVNKQTRVIEHLKLDDPKLLEGNSFVMLDVTTIK
jgi:hypothetical protein